jgi:hypothetical protein
MTEPAFTWRAIDALLAPRNCCYTGCNAPAVAVRGPSSPRLRLGWSAFCRGHASMYGAKGRRSWV